METSQHSLKKSELFHNINLDETEAIVACLCATEKKYGRENDIIEMGSSVDSAGILTKGTAQVVHRDAAGNRMILSEIKEGDLFAEAFAAIKCQSIPVGVVALTNCTVVWFAVENILGVCKNQCSFHKTLSSNFARIIAQKNILFNEKVRLLSCKTTKEKLCMFLSNYAKKTGQLSFHIDFSRDELADFLSVNRSAMSRELSRLQQEGKIQYKKNDFQLNPEEFAIYEGKTCY